MTRAVSWAFTRIGGNRNIGILPVRPAGSLPAVFLDCRCLLALGSGVQLRWAQRPQVYVPEVFHANCLRKRRSFCANKRMSGVSNKIIASRSIPRPKAKPVHFSGL